MPDRRLPKLEQIVHVGVPEEALCFFGRWWQLETYLREVVYVEMRARYGTQYLEHLDSKSVRRAERDQINDYMPSADAGDLLTYLDVGDLLELIDSDFELFEPSLLPERRWAAAAQLLGDLRNRVAHCRRPHKDDLARLEQLLRDLERGAWRFYSSYLDTDFSHVDDPLIRAWVEGQHEDAVRLLEHAAAQYDVRLQISFSRRPWADETSGAVSGNAGYLWHARWLLAGKELQAPELWERVAGYGSGLAELPVHLILSYPNSLRVTFASVDDADLIADAVGHIFDIVLEEARPLSWDPDVDIEAEESKWRGEAADLPRRVQVDTPLANLDPFTPVQIFAAG
jgi:hypothetical protein